MNFEEPTFVSPDKMQDKLVINLTSAESALFFQSIETSKYLHDKHWLIMKSIGKQMENSDFSKQYESSSDDLNSMMLTLLIVSIVLYVITSGGRAMKFMFIMVRALQIIMHLPIIQVLFPANIMIIIRALFPTIGFDIMDSVMEWED